MTASRTPRTPRSADPHPGPAVTSRRRLLLAAAVAPLALAGCGTGLELGQPAPYTPPPPGLDELTRRSALADLRALADGMSALPDDPAGSASRFDDIAASMRATVTQFSTGAETEAASDSSARVPDGAAASDSELDPITSAQSAVAALFTTARSQQRRANNVSASLARMCSASAGFLEYTAITLAADGLGKDPGLPSETDLGDPTKIPSTDTPQQMIVSDRVSALIAAAERVDSSAYLDEVVAAETPDNATSEDLAARAQQLRGRQETLDGFIEALGTTPPTRPAGHRLPEQPLGEELQRRLPGEADAALVAASAQTVAAADPAERPALGIWVLTDARATAAHGGALDILPGVDLGGD